MQPPPVSYVYNMTELLIGIIIGLLASTVVWYVLYHYVVPSIKFFPKIYKYETDENPSGYKYRVRFQNNGNREVIALELFAKLKIKGLSKSAPPAWRAIYIPIDDFRIARLKPQKETGKRFTVQLLISEISDTNQRCLPLPLQQKCQHQELTLEDIMQAGTDATLEIVGFGYDAFSGKRKVFKSKRYTKQHIQAEWWLQQREEQTNTEKTDTSATETVKPAE